MFFNSPAQASAGDLARLQRRVFDLQAQTAIVEQMGEGAATITSAGVVHYVNQRFAEMVDRPQASLLGCPLAALMPSSQHETLQRMRQVSPGRTERAELELFRGTDSTIEILASLSGLRTAGPETHCLIATDLSGIRQFERALSSSDHRFHLMAENISAFIVESEHTGRVFSVTPSVESVLGWTPNALIGSEIAALVHPDDSFFLPSSPFVCQPLVRLRGQDGKHRWMRSLSWPLKGEGSRPCRWITCFHDVDELVQLRQNCGMGRGEDLQRRADTEALTGVANCGEVIECLSRLHHPGHRRDMPLALIVLQLSNALAILHSHGQRTTDQLLQTIAARLRRVTRRRDLLARFGKDALLVVLSDMGNLDQLTRMAERICAEVASPVLIGGVAIHLELSAAVTMENPGDSLEDLLVRACQAGKGDSRIASMAHSSLR